MPPLLSDRDRPLLAVSGLCDKATYEYFGRKILFRTSDFGLLGDLECVVNLNAEISYCALELSMAEKQLYSTKIFRTTVDQCRLRPPHGVGPIRRWIQADGSHPSGDDARILPSREVMRVLCSTREQILVRC